MNKELEGQRWTAYHRLYDRYFYRELPGGGSVLRGGAGTRAGSGSGGAAEPVAVESANPTRRRTGLSQQPLHPVGGQEPRPVLMVSTLVSSGVACSVPAGAGPGVAAVLVSLAVLSCTKRSPMIIETVNRGPLGSIASSSAARKRSRRRDRPGRRTRQGPGRGSTPGVDRHPGPQYPRPLRPRGGNQGVIMATGAPLIIHAADEPYLSRVAEVAACTALRGELAGPGPTPHGRHDDPLRTRSCRCSTPRNPGGCCFYLSAEKLLVSGDNPVCRLGGADHLPGGSTPTLLASIRGSSCRCPTTPG